MLKRMSADTGICLEQRNDGDRNELQDVNNIIIPKKKEKEEQKITVSWPQTGILCSDIMYLPTSNTQHD